MQRRQSNFTSNNSSRHPTPPALTVQTHNLPHLSLSPMDHSPALSAYHTALNTPVSPSPSPFTADDDIPSLYSPHSPMTPAFALNEPYQQPFYQDMNYTNAFARTG